MNKSYCERLCSVASLFTLKFFLSLSHIYSHIGFGNVFHFKTYTPCTVSLKTKRRRNIGEEEDVKIRHIQIK